MSHGITGSFSGSENEEINTAKSPYRQEGVIVAGEVPESDDDEAEEIFEDAIDKSPFSSPPPEQLVQKVVRNEPVRRRNDEFQSLLHRKLRERNERFHKELVTLNKNPYREAIRTMEVTHSNAAKSLKVIEDSSLRLKRLRDDVYLLKVSFDRLIINSSSLPRFKTKETEN